MEGQRDALHAILTEGTALVSDAKGCEIFVVSTSPDDPDSVWFMEVWRSQEDHAASLTDQRIREVIDRDRPMIAGMGSQVTLQPLFGKGLPEAGS